MAIKALLLKKRIDDAKRELEELRSGNDFVTREAELEASIQEAETEEEKAAVDEAVETFEADKAGFEAEEKRLEDTIASLESELAEQQTEVVEERTEEETPEVRKEAKKMETRKFFNMNAEERSAFFGNDNVKDFLARVRESIGEKRAVSGADLLIPAEVLDVIKQNVQEYSKLYKHVRVRKVSGTSRQTVMGIIPEGVWTEMCGKLNEINISFGGVEVDGYKVGGFVPVCNALLEDSDIDLAAEIIATLGQAIGLALDKAILYGTGTKMPLGIVTRLTQTVDPADPHTTIPWTDLSTTNVASVSGKTDIALFKAIIEASGAAKGQYSTGSKFWAMNEATRTKLISNSLSVNAAGAIVAGQDSQMPGIGGTIEVLNFIPDNVIIGGYGDLYLLAERAGASMKRSEEVRFIEDETVFKGTARYDGLPVVANGFVAIDIAGGTVSASAVTFAPDSANP